MGYILILISFSPLRGSLIGVRMTSLSSVPSSFKIQFHEQGPRFEFNIGISMSTRGDITELVDTTSYDTLTNHSKFKKRTDKSSVNTGFSVLFPLKEIRISQNIRLVGLLGLGPSYRWKSEGTKIVNLVENATITDKMTEHTVSLTFKLGVEIPFRLFGQDTRIQFLTHPLSFNYMKSRDTLEDNFGSSRHIQTINSSKFWTQWENLTGGLINTWLMIYIP